MVCHYIYQQILQAMADDPMLDPQLSHELDQYDDPSVRKRTDEEIEEAAEQLFRKSEQELDAMRRDQLDDQTYHNNAPGQQQDMQLDFDVFRDQTYHNKDPEQFQDMQDEDKENWNSAQLQRRPYHVSLRTASKSTLGNPYFVHI